MVAYGCYRGSLLGGSERSKAPAGGTASLWSEGTGLWPSRDWLREVGKKAQEGDEEARHLVDGARLALKGVLYGIEDISVESERVLVRGGDLGGPISAAALSDGYLGMMGWVMDLVARYSERRRALGKPITADFLEQMEGIALVDDIDLHLHPLWQRTLLKNLQKTFPKMTFVGTTHNPQTLIGVQKPEKIYVLQRLADDPRQVEAVPMDPPEGLRADQVLTRYFGEDSTLDDETLELMDDHQRLLLEGKPRTDEQVLSLEEEIRSRIGRFVDTAREAFAYGIVTEILSEEFPKLRPEEREAARQKLKEMAKARLAEREGKKA